MIFAIYLVQILALALGRHRRSAWCSARLLPCVAVALCGDAFPIDAHARALSGAAGASRRCSVCSTTLAFALWPLARAAEVPAAILFRDLVVPAPRRVRPSIAALIACAGAGIGAALAVVGAADVRLAAVVRRRRGRSRWWCSAGAGRLVTRLARIGARPRPGGGVAAAARARQPAPAWRADHGRVAVARSRPDGAGGDRAGARRSRA